MTATDRPHAGITRVGAYRARAGRGTLRPEDGGSTDACAWFGRSQAERLPVMELGRGGVRLAFVAEEGGG